MSAFLLKNVQLVNEGKTIETDVRIAHGKIERIDPNLSPLPHENVQDLSGKFVFPGLIDDQVHFREPGLTHKANIASESRAAVAGGVTSYMEMPNTVPNALTQELLAEKYARAAQCSLANYSFFMGAGNDNFEEVLKTSKTEVCGLKIFMGSSTGDMLVDKLEVLEKLFCKTDLLIATHCEDEKTVRARQAHYQALYEGHAALPSDIHAQIRNEEACYLSSSLAVDLAKRCKSRLHILHLTTEEELALFDHQLPSKDKLITSEVCVHHLWFDAQDYVEKGNLIKCNPSIKAAHHKAALRKALVSGHLDVIATDHAPHTWEEKSQSYWKAPAGLPLVQSPLLMLLDMADEEGWDWSFIAEKTAHAVADIFQIQYRGYVREGYWADLAVVSKNDPYLFDREQILYHCQWSPLEGHTFQHRIHQTYVSGHLAYDQGQIREGKFGERLRFNRA